MSVQNELQSEYQYFNKRGIITKFASFINSLTCNHTYSIVKFKIVKKSHYGKHHLKYQSVRLPLHEQYYECPKCLKNLGPVMYHAFPENKAA